MSKSDLETLYGKKISTIRYNPLFLILAGLFLIAVLVYSSFSAGVIGLSAVNAYILSRSAMSPAYTFYERALVVAGPFKDKAFSYASINDVSFFNKGVEVNSFYTKQKFKFNSVYHRTVDIELLKSFTS